MNDPLELIDRAGRLDRTGADAERVAACVTNADLSSPVASCPGWDLRALAGHLGGVHRWATCAVETAAVPDVTFERPGPEADGRELADWLRSGAAALVEVLRETAPDAATWHPFPVEQRAWVWVRRQMLETAVHRWDAEVAVHGSSDLDAEVAAVGLAEFFELALPRIFVREQVDVPGASLHVHCTDDDLPDGAGEWIAWNEAGEYRFEPAHRKGDAALRGSAVELLFALMGRTDGARLDVVGDPDAAAAWLGLPGF